jgi:ATP-dependent helicase/nuclease subunit B
MAVQFILGRSGTGKTTLCIRSIVDALADPSAAEPLVLLVPEQATYQAERAILSDHRIDGFSRLRVLSFDRLRFLLSARPSPAAELSAVAKEMIIHSILRRNASRLRLFDRTAHTLGLASCLRSLIEELQQYEKQPDDLAQLSRNLRATGSHDNTADKFDDIEIIYRDYLDFLASRQSSFANPDALLTAVRQKVKDAPFLKNAKLWVDGFSGFTPQQRELLVELVKTASDSHIALCLDPSHIDIDNPLPDGIDPADLFNETLRTYAELFDITRKLRLPIAPPVLLREPRRFADSPPLAHVEKNIFSRPDTPKISAGDHVTLVSAADTRAEVVYIARTIHHLVRTQNCRWRQIAVIASDLAAYQHFIEAIFAEYDIPCFIDRPRPLASHPLVELIVTALQVVGDRFAPADVLAFLKTPFSPVAPDVAAMLENYCLAFGVTSDNWRQTDDWSFAPPDDKTFAPALINDARRRAIKPLIDLRDSLAPSDPQTPLAAEQFTRAIWRLLDTLDISTRLLRWSENDPDDPHRHLQAYDKIVDLFDSINRIFADSPLPLADLNAIATSALLRLTLKLIPSSLDQVLVGSIERSRHPDLKAVFLIGATQKQFPVPLSFDPLVDDRDRQLADACDFALSDKLSLRLASRQYLAYIAFTRPADRLCITSPLLDNEAKPLARSSFVDTLSSLFTDLSEQTFTDVDCDPADIFTPSDLKKLLASTLGGDSASDDDSSLRYSQLLDCLCNDTDPALARLGTTVRSFLSCDNRPALSPVVSSQLTGGTLDCSVTRLASYAACPYKHFARYMLNLRPRTLFRLEPVDLGDFYHRVLDRCTKTLRAANTDWTTLSNDQLIALCAEQISHVISTDSFLSSFNARSPHNAWILDSAAKTVQDCLCDLVQISRAGAFRPHSSELKFAPGASAKTFRLQLDNQRDVILRGSIDRVDLAQIDGKTVALILDYKRKPQSVSWCRLYYGLDIQLALYVLALTGAKLDDKTVDSVAGAFFVPIEPPVQAKPITDLDKSRNAFLRKTKGILDAQYADKIDTPQTGWSKYYNLRYDKNAQPFVDFGRTGVLTAQQFAAVLDHTRQTIRRFAEEIFSGHIDVKPYRISRSSPCSRCDYKSLCRFDWQINDYNDLPSLGKTTVLEKLGVPHD